MKYAALLLALAAVVTAKGDESATTITIHPAVNAAGGVFQQSITNLPDVERERFEHGKSLMQRAWVIAPSTDTEGDGLGPLFNQRSCAGCHPNNGRGRAPDTPQEPLSSALVRLSVPGEHGPVAHPVYGGQFNEHGIPGVLGEGRISISYTLSTITLSGGEHVSLRQPHITFAELNYGPMSSNTLTSLRVGPAVFGLGLIELVSDDTLLEYADPEDANHDGISGRANLLWNKQQQRRVVGRFGLKANTSDLHMQVALAFSEDLGLTSTRFPESNCTATQTACLQAPNGGSPEIIPAKHSDLPFYLMQLAPPVPRHTSEARRWEGAALFRSIGCAACHRESMTTGDSTEFPALAHIEFHPYSDLLLHDMGTGLSDGRPDQQAGSNEWRTAPLWGSGLAQRVDASARFLHDGRARNITEAVLWHGGEAETAKEKFRLLNKNERTALLDFLATL